MFALHKTVIVSYPGILRLRVSSLCSRFIYKANHLKPMQTKSHEPRGAENTGKVVKSIGIVLGAFLSNAAALKLDKELNKTTPEDESYVQAKHYGLQAPCFH